MISRTRCHVEFVCLHAFWRKENESAAQDGFDKLSI